MWFQTLRGKLTLWNIGILTVTLLLFGLLLNFGSQRRLAGEIDRQLRDRVLRGPAGRPPPPPAQAREGQPDDLGLNGPPDGQPQPQGDLDTGQSNPPNRPPVQAGEGPGNRRRPEAASDSNQSAGRPLGPPELQHYDATGKLVGPDVDAQPFDILIVKKALTGQEIYSDVTYAGVPMRVIAAPVYHGGQIDGAVETARDMTDFQELWQQQTVTLVILVPLALGIAGLGAFFLTNRALKPVGALTAAAEQISVADLSKRLNVEGKDEFAHLAQTFNGMISRLESSFNNLKSAFADLEKAYENQRRFTADASHELRTPLTRLRLATSAALSHPDEPKTAMESLVIANQAVDSMNRIVEQLLLLSRADAGQLGLQSSPLDLRVAAAEAADSFHDPRIAVDLPDLPCMVLGDEDHLKRVFLNLLENARRFTQEDGRILVKLTVSNGQCRAVVSDSGEGIPPEHLAHIGERFYRVDTARSRKDGGSGLGISICRSIVEAHGGHLVIDSRLGQGTTVRFDLPLVSTK